MKKTYLEQYKNFNAIELEIRYNIGGMNYFSSQVEPRGYYLSITPVQKGEHTTVYRAFSGIKILIREVKRKNDKLEHELWDKIEHRTDELKDFFKEGRTTMILGLLQTI